MVPQQAAPGQIAAKMLSWDTKHPLSCPSGFWHSLTSSRVKFRRLTAHSTNGTWQDLLYSAIWVIQSSHITPKIAQPKIHPGVLQSHRDTPSPWCLPALGTPFSPAIFGGFCSCWEVGPISLDEASDLRLTEALWPQTHRSGRSGRSARATRGATIPPPL